MNPDNMLVCPNGGLRIDPKTDHIVDCTQMDIDPNCECTISRLHLTGYHRPPENSTLFSPHWNENFGTDCIQQGKSADCWLIATLISLSMNPDGQRHLYNMMLDDGKYVFVKLSQKVYPCVDPKPPIIKMTKSLFTFQLTRFSDFNPLFCRHKNRILWPDFIEKALVFSAYFKNSFSYQQLDNREVGAVTSYLERIIGIPFDRKSIPRETRDRIDDVIYIDDKFYSLIIKGNVKELVNRYPQIFTSKPEANECVVFFNQAAPIDPQNKLTFSCHNSSELAILLEGLNPAIKTKFIAYVDKIMKKRKHTYSFFEHNLFIWLRDEVFTRNAIATTANYMPDSYEKGLQGKHEYAVLGVIGDPEKDEQLFVTLANPWGHTGRSYELKDGEYKPVETSGGTFNLHLDEFARFFTGINYSTEPLLHYPELPHSESLRRDSLAASSSVVVKGVTTFQPPHTQNKLEDQEYLPSLGDTSFTSGGY